MYVWVLNVYARVLRVAVSKACMWALNTSAWVLNTYAWVLNAYARVLRMAVSRAHESKQAWVGVRKLSVKAR